NRENLPRLQAKLSGASTGLTPWRVTEFPKPPWLGPERRPKTHRTEFSLTALSFGLRRSRL
ncbi:MAG: hypothetical protein AAFU84_18545, partial [Cyanobacteria bacterium J06633_23]